MHLLTGRTHQIRVHAQHAGHPILGDAKYSFEEGDALAEGIGLKRLFLHAASLQFRVGEDRLCLEAPLDDELEGVCQRLRARR